MMKLLKRLISLTPTKPMRGIVLFLFFIFYTNISFAVEWGTVCLKQSCFHVEVARTPSEKRQGLMSREQLTEKTGMFFVYPKENRPVFWMKNMLISLDFVWLNALGQVVDLSENIAPCKTEDCPTLKSHVPIQYVFEVPAGSIRASQIKNGDMAVIQLGEKA